MKIFLSELLERFPEFDIRNNDEKAYFTGFSHDSREINEGDLYIPIVGERFDGHAFIAEALRAGGSVALCEKSKVKYIEDVTKPVILVDSIEEGLKKVLNYSIGYIKNPVVAITGSTGKTTTKEMLVFILKNHMSVLSADRYNTVWGNAVLLGNYNGEDVIVLECGMDRKGEIAWHVMSVDPDYGVLLNVGDVHAEKVGSIDDIFQEKKDLADYMERTGKPLVLNIDDSRLKHIAENYNKDSELIKFGKDSSAEYQIEDISVDHEGTHFKFRYYHDNVVDVSLKVYGEGYVYNAMAAIIVANDLGVSIDNCVKDIANYVSKNARFEKLEYGDITIINDAYNANPTSMKMALDTFSDLYKDGYYTIAILGDMKELGDVSNERHEEIAKLVESKNFNELYYIGENIDKFKDAKELESADEAAAMLNTKLAGLGGKKVAILLKGSNSLGLYQVPDFLKKLGVF